MAAGSYTFDDGTHGAAITTATSPFFNAVDAGFTFSNLTPVAGLGAAYNVASATRAMNVGFTAAAAAYCSFRIVKKTADANNLIVATCWQGATKLAELQWMGTGILRIRNNVTAVGATVGTFGSVDRDLRLEWRVSKGGTNTQELRVYDAWGTTPLETISGAATQPPTTVDTFTFGSLVTSAGGGTFIIDDVGWSTDGWIGPISAPPATGPAYTVWNGSAEVPATVKVWNGSAEVAVTSGSVT